ncbi:hypothetical protein [Phreatobacter stygius]|uniref:Uncharacterized protein n=1 Tax=Phreatobacter stygius TaxID=1940610 RepID=A0A4D7BCP7_9HYPH|nr:hypothetical protein [Phreatobacter stygius]QCI67788.1 hypothetical protein E8M01_28325 [Phreatobacter stygius]
MRDDIARPGPRCLYSLQDIRQMRLKFDQTCEELGLFHEDREARAAVGRAVVKAFATGLAETPPTFATETLPFEGEGAAVRTRSGGSPYGIRHRRLIDSA